MDDIGSLKTYSDLRRFVSQPAFTRTMNFLAWHNRQKMTPMMEPWQALTVAFFIEEAPLEPAWYPAVKLFFGQHQGRPPISIEECRQRADELGKFLRAKSQEMQT